jgi:hypothetical protein
MALTVLHCALKLECGIAQCIGVLPTATISLSTSSCSRLLSGGGWHVPGLWCERARTRVERYEELRVCHDGLG